MATSSPIDSVGLHVVVATAFTIWVIVDSLKRKKLAWGYAIFSFLWMWWICLPFYFAGRKLLPGETREGGYGWNVCKFFMLLWTFLLAYCLLGGMVNVSNSLEGKEMGAAESAGTAIGVGIGVGFFFCLYVGVAIPVLITGLLLKKNSEVERGATAPGSVSPVRAAPIQTNSAASGAAVGGAGSISVARNGQNIGTFDVSTFKQNVASGSILPTDHYWIKGMTAWAPVSTYRD
jgi:hypothetical protein